MNKVDRPLPGPDFVLRGFLKRCREADALRIAKVKQQIKNGSST